MSESGATLVRRLVPILIVLAAAVLGAALLGPMVQDGLDAGRTDPPPPTVPSATSTPAAVAPSPDATPAPAITPATLETAAPSAPPAERTIDIEATTALEFLDERGRPLRAIVVRAGERVRFRVDNTAGYGHSFSIGPFHRLEQGDVEGLPGIPMWLSGVRELSWVVPDDVTELAFGCTVPGHFVLMNGQLDIVGGP